MAPKYLRIYLLVFLPYFGISICPAQTIWRSKTTSQEICEIYTQNLQNCEEAPYCKIENFSCADLVVHPNGNFYITGNSRVDFNWRQEIRVYDTCEILTTILLPEQVANINLGHALTTLCADKNGQIFIALSGKKNIYKFDPISEIFTDLGILPNGMEVFDFTFRNGILYASGTTSTNSYIMEIDLNDISKSKVLFSDINNAYYAKLITVPNLNDCNEAETYISRELNNGPEIGILDFTDESFTQICVDEGNGMASSLEFLASDPECDLLFDLDRDNSSGEFPYDFRNDAILCADDKSTHIVDSDVYLHTSAELDSVRILLKFASDTICESISFESSIPDAVLLPRTSPFSDQLYYSLILTNDRSDQAYINALKALRYNHICAIITPGQRYILFDAYNAIKNRGATTIINIDIPPYAGIDTTITNCTTQVINNISSSLGGQSGGSWEPSFELTDIYNSAVDTALLYSYITQTGCGYDTSTLTVIKPPLRTLDLGPDISICRAESHAITIPTITGDEVLWSDGNTQANRVLTSPGQYMVSITTVAGCVITDSITITRSYAKIPKATSIDICEGELYTYKGNTYQSGDIIIDSLQATSGCDTLVTLTLRAIAAPSISRDTTTCDNIPITLDNKTYQIGDTISLLKNSPTGCDTVIQMVYRFYQSSIAGLLLQDTVVCKDLKTQAIIDASSFSGLIWSNGEQSLTSLFGAGNHFLQATDDRGCVRIIPFEIKSYPSIQYDIQATDPSCGQNNGSISIINNLPDLSFTTSINGIITQSRENLPADKYNITLIDVNGCETQDSITLTNISDLDVTLPSEISGIIGQIISIAYQSSGGSIDTITFSPSSDINWAADSIAVFITGDRVYSITFIDEYGCTVTKTLTIDAEIPTSTLVLPNIVTLQSTDPQNALFYLKTEGITYDMSIYDRWGNLIHNAQKITGGDPTQAWQPSQSKVGPGVYVYLISVYTDDGVVHKYGTVTVL
ncbi:MAG TPA: gliding motility-associated C-terminal domain-containing protein [Saprospiraceae bacterium]|nr:gliding motility-associated C-terminal domain-containing protein [Saprospiraceae bacterium]